MAIIVQTPQGWIYSLEIQFQKYKASSPSSPQYSEFCFVMEISYEAEDWNHLFLKARADERSHQGKVESIIHPWLQASYSQAGGAVDWQD